MSKRFGQDRSLGPAGFWRLEEVLLRQRDGNEGIRFRFNFVRGSPRR